VPPEPLTRERIVVAAVAMADAEGLEAITMRRLGAALDREAMSLYHHIPSKEALLAALVDTVLEELARHSAAIDYDDWRVTVRARCLAARDLMLRHPWAPALVAAQHESPATVWPIYELFIGTLTDGGFDDELSHRAIHSLGSMLFGFTTELFEPAPSDEPDVEAMRAAAEKMPNLARMAASVVHEVEGSLSMCDTQAEFEFTLGLLLNGLEHARVQATA
jgi:AcrR family transcriptional regulator